MINTIHTPHGGTVRTRSKCRYVIICERVGRKSQLTIDADVVQRSDNLDTARTAARRRSGSAYYTHYSYVRFTVWDRVENVEVKW